MNKKTSKFQYLILILIILIAIFVIFILPKLGGAYKLSESGQFGNTAGNLYNTGLFCENKGRIYFANPSDDGMLYSMNTDLSDFKKLSSDKIQYINADDNYIFYSRINNMKKIPSDNIFVFFNAGLFRVDKNGGNLAMLDNKPIGMLNLFDNRVFYQYYDEAEGISIHTSDIDGENNIRLLKEDSLPAAIYSNKLYYSATLKDHGIHALDINSGTDTVLLNKGSFMPIAVSNGIYYISTLNNYSIYQVSFDGADEKLLINGICSTYNLSPDGRYIFYQLDGSDNNGIYMFDTLSSTSNLIAYGDYKWFHTAGGYLFFYSFDGKFIYNYKPGGVINTFTPPVLSN